MVPCFGKTELDRSGLLLELLRHQESPFFPELTPAAMVSEEKSNTQVKPSVVTRKILLMLLH